MRTICLLLLTLGAGGGCLHLPYTEKEEAKPATTLQRPPVTPEQVKETTAHRVAASLDQEVTIDETTPVPKPPPVEEKKPAAKAKNW